MNGWNGTMYILSIFDKTEKQKGNGQYLAQQMFYRGSYDSANIRFQYTCTFYSYCVCSLVYICFV